MAKKTWTPPETLTPITAQAYALMRVYIDTGAAAVAYYAKRRSEGCESECWQEPKPSVQVMARTIYQHLPLDALDRGPAQAYAETYYPDDPSRFPDTDLAMVGWPTFVDRAAAIAALDAATSPEVLAELGPLDRTPQAGEGQPDGTANGSDPGAALNWWVLALSAGGFLSWLGKSKLLAALSPHKKIVALIVVVATALKWLGAAGAVAEVWEGSKKVIDEVIVKPAAKGASVLFYVLGAAAGIGAAAIIYKAVTRPKPAPLVSGPATSLK